MFYKSAITLYEHSLRFSAVFADAEMLPKRIGVEKSGCLFFTKIRNSNNVNHLFKFSTMNTNNYSYGDNNVSASSVVYGV